MDLLLLALIALGIVLVAFALAVIKRPLAAPQKPQNVADEGQAALVRSLSSRVDELEQAGKGFRRQLGELESTVELRHRSLTGFIAKKMGKRAGEEADQATELPPGPERDALIERVTQGMQAQQPELQLQDDPNTWPMHLVGGSRPRRTR